MRFGGGSTQGALPGPTQSPMAVFLPPWPDGGWRVAGT
jgi:hypothetical protein